MFYFNETSFKIIRSGISARAAVENEKSPSILLDSVVLSSSRRLLLLITENYLKYEPK